MDTICKKLSRLDINDICASYKQNMHYIDTWDFEQGFEKLVDNAYKLHHQRQIKALLKRSNIRYRDAVLRKVNLYRDFYIEGADVGNIVECKWIKSKQTVIVQGKEECGKTYLACALVKQACKSLLDAFYVRSFDLKRQIDEAKQQSEIYSLIDTYSSYDVLVIDDWLVDRPSAKLIDFLYEVIEKRYKTHSTIRPFAVFSG